MSYCQLGDASALRVESQRRHGSPALMPRGTGAGIHRPDFDRRDQGQSAERGPVKRIPATATAAPAREALGLELARSDVARYVQRLHAVLLVCAGYSCTEVASVLNRSPRTVERWVEAYESEGIEPLRQHHAGGRPPSQASSQLLQIGVDIELPPSEFGYRHARWSGKLLALHLEKQYHQHVSIRQCQRWLAGHSQSDALVAEPTTGSDARPSLAHPARAVLAAFSAQIRDLAQTLPATNAPAALVPTTQAEEPSPQRVDSDQPPLAQGSI